MSHKAEFTVIIPAWNEEKLLPMTLAALEQQTQPPAAVIVIDNNSRDHTTQVAQAWGATVLQCPTRGVTHARQMGLEAARTSWIATTDADSRPHPDWLKHLGNATHGRVALYGPMRFFGVGANAQWMSHAAYSSFLHMCRLIQKPNLAGGNMAYSRMAALMAGGYPAWMEAQEDVVLGQELARLGEVAYVPSALVETSARRLDKGLVEFAWRHTKNMMGQTRNYFDELREVDLNL